MKDRMTTLRRFVALALALPFALALAACGGSKEDDTAPPKGGPIAAIAPPAGQQWGDVASETKDGGFVIGNPNAPLKLVEYGSHTCSHAPNSRSRAAAHCATNTSPRAWSATRSAT
jgi:protein-disulfide isomerase